MRFARQVAVPDLLGTYFLPDSEDRANAELRLFRRIRLPGGAAKTTFPHRFDDLNDLVAGMLPRERRLSVFDAGASSCITSLEWSDQLAAAGIDHELLAGDLCLRGWLTSVGWSASALFDADGYPLLLEFGRLSVSTVSDRHPSKAALAGALLRLVDRGGRAFARAQPGAPPRRYRWLHRELLLVSPTILRRGGVTTLEDDVLIPGRFLARFDALRAANVVTPAYFDLGTLTEMLSNLASRVCDGGLLILCRTRGDGTNDATVFRRAGPELTVAARLNDGSEVEELALSTHAR